MRRIAQASEAERWAAASAALTGLVLVVMSATVWGAGPSAPAPSWRVAVSGERVPDSVRTALAEFAPARVNAAAPQGETSAAVAELAPDLTLEDEGAEGGVQTQTVRVEAGDTLGRILEDLGASREDALAMIAALKPIYDPRNIRQGQELQVTISPLPIAPSQSRSDQTATVQLIGLTMSPSIEREVRVERDADGRFAAMEQVKALHARHFRAEGIIDGSLILSATRAQIPLDVTYQFIRVFSYDIDFQRDLRAGDGFEIFFTRYFDDAGNPVKEGEVVMGAMTLSGRRKALYRFTPSDDGVTDYFDENGASAKKFLMRTPIDGGRVTSGFGMRRHPILGYSKMHRGVDFGAPTGTPVMAAGNGVIEMAGWHGGYGKYVRLRHANGYATAYAHLSRYGQGVTRGARIRQGQIIGYVGSTGRSTGPHLHYEVMVNGAQVNPVSVKLPTGRKLEGRNLQAFKAELARTQGLIAAAPSLSTVASGGPETAPAPGVEVVPAQGGAE